MAKILCIDDNAHGLAARRLLLEKMGYQVAVSRNGREGLETLRREKMDLVIVDYVMPQMNGAEVVREAKRLSPKVPVILLSAYAEALGLEEKVKEADCVLNKGRREVSELTSAVPRLLRRSRTMKKPAASVKANPTAVKAKSRKLGGRKPSD